MSAAYDTKSQHTPGPWALDGEGPELATVWAPERPNIEITAPARSRFNEPSDDECAANARLIAAAPDLLTALRDLLDGDGNLLKAMDRARTALAKAEGRS
jgi:hypothetical protein